MKTLAFIRFVESSTQLEGLMRPFLGSQEVVSYNPSRRIDFDKWKESLGCLCATSIFPFHTHLMRNKLLFSGVYLRKK